MAIGSNIKTARKAKGFSQAYLADICGVSVQAVSQWENGKTTPSHERLAQISTALEISLNSLFVDDENPDRWEDRPPHFSKAYDGRVPVIRMEDAVFFSTVMMHRNKAPEPLETIEPTFEIPGVSFAIEVTGDDILPPLMKADLIVFEVGLRVSEGDIVIFNGILRGGTLSDTTFGRVERVGPEDEDPFGDGLHIAALDEAHAVEEHQNNSYWRATMILGVATEIRRSRRAARGGWR